MTQTSNPALWRSQARKTVMPKMWGMVILLLLSAWLAISQGALEINFFAQPDQFEWAILRDIRLPRVLMTMATGAGLAVCGLMLQAVSRNPLADPGLIGVSAGAALFASAAILISSLMLLPPWLNLLFIPGMAFTGAALALAILLVVASYRQGMNTLVLILAGVAINAGATTLLGLVSYLAEDDTLRVITFWQMGSYSGTSWWQALLAIVIFLVAISVFVCKTTHIMLLQISEQHAFFQGVNVSKLKRLLLLLVALVTAICVCFTGIVGFVGLVVPHISRMLVGEHLKLLLPATALLGAALVTLADLCARLLVVPAELPVGLLTSALGVPFFLWLILREKRKFTYD